MRGFSLLPILLASAVAAEESLFTQMDADKNGKVSPAELPAEARPFLGLVDIDGDGQLSKPEFDRIAANLQSLMPQEPAEETGTRNIDYAGTGHQRHTLDLYFPEEAGEKPLPLVVYIHGGGWMAGSKQEGRGFADVITATGQYAVASINYRLIQDALWPAQIHDCKAAIRFLRGNAAKFGIHADQIAVMGSSAGGHLATLLGTSGREPELEGSLGKFNTVSSTVRAVVNFFGPTNFETFFGKDSDIVAMARTNAPIRVLGDNDEQIRLNARLASPIHWITRNDPPVLTAHGTEDRIVPFTQAAELDEKLREAGVESHLIAMQGGGHGFGNEELNLRIKAFLDRHLRGQETAVSSEPIRLR